MKKMNNEAISAVIGTLMIVVITVSAASAFSIFVAQQQEKFEKQETMDTSRELERIKIIDWEIIYNQTDNTLDHMNITIKNQHISDSIIQIIKINQQPIWPYDQIRLGSQAQKAITVDELNYTTSRITINDSITFNIKTIIGNTFIQTFYPPTPLGTISYDSIYNGSGYDSLMILDATNSDSINDDTYIIKHKWNISGTIHNTPIYTLDPTLITTGDFISLQVIDNHGMMSSRKYI